MSGLRISTHDLTVRYGDLSALDAVSLDLAPDRIHGLLGRNGAGKTTLLSVLASLRRPSSGEVALDGVVPFEREQLMEQVCVIRESGDLLGDEKVRDNLDFQQMARPRFDRAWAEELLADFGVPLRRSVKKLSRGQRSALGAVVGLASRTPLTMFDEVHLGMDAPSRQRFYDTLLADFAEHPRTIVLSSHLISEVEHLLETVTILHEGRLLISAETEGLRPMGATLTGPRHLVAQASATQRVIAARDLGPTRQVTVFGDLDLDWVAQARHAGLDIGAVPLQDLFIHLTEPGAQLSAAGSVAKES